MQGGVVLKNCQSDSLYGITVKVQSERFLLRVPQSSVFDGCLEDFQS
jgi:hypothetical protein